ncbi:MAG: hypothetical protein AAB573_05430 [Patescibacteria group bacterium]
MSIPFIGDRPPRQPEHPIRFEAVKRGMYIRVVRHIRGHFEVGTQDMVDAREEIIAQGEVVSNINDIITLKGGVFVEKAHLDRNTSIYKGHAPRTFDPDVRPGIPFWDN